MWFLPSPSVRRVKSQLTTALTLANGTAVHALSPADVRAVRAVYSAFDAAGGQPSAALQPPALAGALSALHDCFNQVQVGGRLATLRAKLLGNTHECPLCGYGEPTTLDHYLPRSAYQVLAIYPRNLIPACQPCNRKKGTGVPNGVKGFVHPYLDPLAEADEDDGEPFLHADVDYGRGVLRVAFRIDHPTLDPTTLGRLRHQLEELQLNRRYAAPINTFIAAQKTALRQFRGPTAARTRKAFLESAAADWAEDFGLNDWRSALLRGLAANAAFCSDPEPYLKRARRRRR